MNKEYSSTAFTEGGNEKGRCLSLVSCHQEAKVKPWKQVSDTRFSPIRGLLAASGAFYLESLKKTSTWVQQPQQNQSSST